MKILIVTATERELEGLGLDRFDEGSHSFKTPAGSSLSTLVTGVGIVATTWSLMKHFASDGRPDIILNAGIAGSFRDNLPPGSVVITGSDAFAELGTEDDEGFTPLWEMNIQGAGLESYAKLEADHELTRRLHGDYRVVRGVTVNKVTGTEESRGRMIKLFNPDIETMETAAVYWVCMREGIRAVSVRSVSNMVAVRNRSEWDIPGALNSLSEAIEYTLRKIN